MPVATRVSVVVLSIAGQDGKTFTIDTIVKEAVEPAVPIVSEAVAPGTRTPPFCSSTVAVPVASVVKVVVKDM
jgi:hypothetical protein